MARRKIEIVQTMHEKKLKWIVREGTDLLYTANTPVEAMEWIGANVGFLITCNMYI
jgi:hypothetical protein